MSIIEIILISIGLAMDAFAVSVCKGISIVKITQKKAIIIGLWFGIFQGLMPTIGFFLGKTFEAIIINVDHWIAFVLLSLIGGNMLKEVFSNPENQTDDTSFKTMILLSLATSVDALAVGIAYVCAYGSYNAALTFILIAIITFIISVIGVKIGNKFGNRFEVKAQFVGGLILIFLGFKILVEHLGFI